MYVYVPYNKVHNPAAGDSDDSDDYGTVLLLLYWLVSVTAAERLHTARIMGHTTVGDSATPPQNGRCVVSYIYFTLF